jgi:hypothetical protein
VKDLPPTGPAGYILVDIDHCLTDAAWRDDLRGTDGERNWDRYHEAAKDDKPVQEMIDLVNLYDASGYFTVGLTSRPERFRQMTQRWLGEFGVMLDELLMRPDDSRLPTAEDKKLQAIRYFGSEDSLRTEVAFVLDDRDDVATMFRGLGITVLQVFIRSRR